jgi:hypothetical protein
VAADAIHKSDEEDLLALALAEFDARSEYVLAAVEQRLASLPVEARVFALALARQVLDDALADLNRQVADIDGRSARTYH